MSKEKIEKLRTELALADAGCPPNTYCEYSCASCAADSRLEDDGVKNVRLLLAEIDHLTAVNEQLRKNVQHWMEECFKENKAKVEAKARLEKCSEALRTIEVRLTHAIEGSFTAEEVAENVRFGRHEARKALGESK